MFGYKTNTWNMLVTAICKKVLRTHVNGSSSTYISYSDITKVVRLTGLKRGSLEHFISFITNFIIQVLRKSCIQSYFMGKLHTICDYLMSLTGAACPQYL